MTRFVVGVRTFSSEATDWRAKQQRPTGDKQTNKQTNKQAAGRPTGELNGTAAMALWFGRRFDRPQQTW
jgi:hypothetical protein